ncbi:MAG: Calx-beta domain-containing protein [Cyanobacteriota bacterium]
MQQRLADPPTSRLAGAQPASLQPLMYFNSEHQFFEFTYYYGNGDFYRGNGYTLPGIYFSGQVLGSYSNEASADGFYVIDYAENVNGPGYPGIVTINAYYDAATDADSFGVGGYGYADLVWGEGLSGLGSESGEAYNSQGTGTGDNFFSISASADLIANDQEYGFTFYYDNGDFYSGYGYATAGLYTVGQVIPSPGYGQVESGYYEITYLLDLGYETFSDPYVLVNSYFDAATDGDGAGVGGSGYASYVWGESYSGLGLESGTALNENYEWSGDNSFSNTNSADISPYLPATQLQIFDFVYYYGDGDFYQGYGVASLNTYYIGQIIPDISNDTSQMGYYYIWSSQGLASESDVEGSVYINAYYDGSTDLDGLGSGGYGYASYVYGGGSNGLGSEHGTAFNVYYEFTNDNYFANNNSADIYSTVGDQEYGFTYYYGNGDSYSGYGFSGYGIYQAGQAIGNFFNDTYNWGYYIIDYTYDLGYESSDEGLVYIKNYYDAGTDLDGLGSGGYGTAVYVSGQGDAGLGSEMGTAYNWMIEWTGDNIFSNTNSADLILGDQQYNYTYYYGDGDFYRGYGYAVSGTYSEGQWIQGVYNDTNNLGYYLIDSVQELDYNTYEDAVFITEYYDASSDLDGIGLGGYGHASYVSGEGYSGLGSESGEAFNSDYFSTGDNLISNSSSADMSAERDQIFVFTYYYGDGDFYTGYGYADANTYAAGDVIGYFANDTSNLGYYVIEYAYDPGYYSYSDGYIVIDSYYDASTDVDGVGMGRNGYATYVYGSGYYGLGSEAGDAYDESHRWTGDNYFSNSSSADILFPGIQEFGFTYQYGNGDYYTGIGYAALGSYFAGQTIGFYANDTGNTGYYTINYVTEYTDAVQENGMIFLDVYYDASTDTDDIGKSQHGAAFFVGGGGSSGLGSESGEAYNYDASFSGDNYFSNYSSADLVYVTDQLFEFTYYYGDGDSYGGYGYADADTYFAGQRLEFFANDTGYLGYYIIDSVADLGFETANTGAVYLNRYYDANTDLDGLGLGAQGPAANVGGAGYEGLGSEIGEAYNWSFDWSFDNVFSAANSADLAMSGYQEFGFTYYYGDGDYYTGYGQAAGGLYHAGQVISGVYNDTGNVGHYVIEFVSSLPDASYAGNHIVLGTYYDFATDLDGIATGSYGYAYSCWGMGSAGLGSEYGEAYGSDYAATGDNAFNPSSSADLFPPTTFALLASSADKAEGNSGFTRFNFVVSRSGDLSSAASVNWSIVGSGIHSANGDDFLTGGLRSGIVRFAAGEQSRDLSLRIKGDTIYEQDEQFTLTIFNPVGGVVDPTRADALAIIRNDDLPPPPQPTLSLVATSAEKTEGDGSSKKFSFTVARSGDLSQTSSVDWSVAGSGANPAGMDDFAKAGFSSGSIRFAEGEAMRDISIRVAGDTLYEQDEQFTVSLFNPVGAAIDTNFIEAIGTIRNDDPLPSPILAIAATAADKLEGSGSKRFTFTVTRSGDLSQSSSAEWFLSGSGLDPASPDDFLTERFDSGVIRFEADQSSRELSIRIRGDLTPEPDEQFTVALFNPIGASLDLSATEAIGIIRNDDFSSSSALTSAPATLWQPMAGMPWIGGT